MNLFSDIRALVVDSLTELTAEGALPAGLDLSAVAVEAARSRGLRATQIAADDFVPARRYACITAFDLVEHLIDPNPFLARVRDWLAPTGNP